MNARSRALPSHFQLALAAAPLALGACHGSTEIHVGAPPVPTYAESEPNDDAHTADYFGYLYAHQKLCIEGDVRDDAYDPQDGFAFVAGEPIVVDFVLDAGCQCADLDVWIYDPLLDEFVGVFDSPQASERGTFTVYSQAFHIVVVSAGGDASYRLEVSATPMNAALEVDAERPAIGGAVPRPAPARAPSAALETYRRRAELTGAPRLFEVFVIDPENGVVEGGWIPARN